MTLPAFEVGPMAAARSASDDRAVGAGTVPDGTVLMLSRAAQFVADVQSRLASADPALALAVQGVRDEGAAWRVLEQMATRAAIDRDAASDCRETGPWVVAIGPGFAPEAVLRILVEIAVRWPTWRVVSLVLEGGDDPGLFAPLLDVEQLYYVSPAAPDAEATARMIHGACRHVERRAASSASATLDLAGFARRLAFQDDPADLATLVADRARLALAADDARAWLYDVQLDALWTPNDHGGRRVESAAIGLASFVLRTGRVLRLDRAQDDPRFDRDLDGVQSADIELAETAAPPGAHRYVAACLTDEGGAIGVVACLRNAVQPAFNDDDQRALESLAAAASPFVAPWIVNTGPAAAQEDAGLFRAAAVEQHRRADDEPAEVVRLSARWSRATYWVLLAAFVLGLLFALIGEVGEFATGQAIVRFGSRTEIETRIGGTVAAVEVSKGDAVVAGQTLVRIHDAIEQADLARLESEWRWHLANRLRDPADLTVEQTLIGLRAERRRLRSKLEERVIRADRDGVVGVVWARVGQQIEPGQPVVAIDAGQARPSIDIVVPAHHRPKLAVGQPIRLTLDGYARIGDRLTLSAIGNDTVSPGEDRKLVDQALGEIARSTGPSILASASLPSESFTVGDRRFRFHDGMKGQCDIRIGSERIIFALFPALRNMFRWAPDTRPDAPPGTAPRASASRHETPNASWPDDRRRARSAVPAPLEACHAA